MNDERILVLAPAGFDSSVVCELLQTNGIFSAACADAKGLAAEAEEGVGALLLTEEALSHRATGILRELLQSQPAWSQIPVLVLVGGEALAEKRKAIVEALGSGINLRVLDRPIRHLTLLSLVQSALQGRRRQYEVRDLLDRLSHQTAALQEANTALKILLKQRDDDKREFAESVLGNIKTLITPYIEKLKESPLSSTQATWVGIIESHLGEVASPFGRVLGLQSADLTPTEMRVATLVRDGKSTAEISQTLGISEKTVTFHRYNLRIKLGLRGGRSNLRSYLLNLT